MTDETIIRVLDNNASTKEARMVASWFSKQESTSAMLQHIDSDLNSEWERQLQAQKVRSKTWRIIANVACFVGLMVGSWIGGYTALRHLVQPENTPAQQIAYSARGERTQIMLQDGTRIYLNSESQISFPTQFNWKERRVHLDGEAYFEVAKNPRRPFIVEVGDASIKVLGTKFNASYYRNEPIRVTLDEGSISFSIPEQEDVLLQPGEMVTYDSRTGQRLFKRAMYAQSGNWRYNRLEIDDLPLADVIKILERRYDVSFHVDNERCYRHSYTFAMEDNSLQQVLERMANLSHIRFRYNESQKTIFVE